MEDAMMDRLRIASDLQARIRRVEDAAVEYALACEACAQTAGEASAWCKGEDSAELEAVTAGLGSRMADARETARDLHRAASCVADGVIAAALEAMSPEDRETVCNAWAAAMTPAEYETLDADMQAAVLVRRDSMGLPLECLPDMRWGSGTGIPLDLLREWTAQKASRSPSELQTGGRGASIRPDASEAPSAVLEAGEGMSGGEAVHG